MTNATTIYYPKNGRGELARPPIRGAMRGAASFERWAGRWLIRWIRLDGQVLTSTVPYVAPEDRS